MKQNTRTSRSPFTQVWHDRILAVYILLVASHFAEHILQAMQVFIFDWSRPDAGGLLGLQFPGLVSNESLHFVYNFIQLFGLLALYQGFFGRARTCWNIAIVFQGWHFLEHFLLQSQWLTGIYLFNAPKQTSILEHWIPRVELHFIYNAMVVVPTFIALALHIRQRLMSRQVEALATA